jgi:hypothetical protein
MAYKPDRKFQELAAQVNQALEDNEGLIGDQKAQVERLMTLEKRFQKRIRPYSRTITVYQKFIDHIVIVHGNILNAQSYFREKKEALNKGISPAIKNRDVYKLMNFHINFQMIQFIKDNWGSPLPKELNKIYEDIKVTRNILIENNLPLAINRAKIFYRKNKSLHYLTILDLINICTMGLAVGVDKYVGDYTKVWRSVSIGRMVGYMIEECSQTFLRMYPTDRKILYRTNSLRYKHNIENISELTKVVNRSFEEDRDNGKPVPHLPISEIHIKTLLNGLSYDSVYITDDNDDDVVNLYDQTCSQHDVEETVSNKQLLSLVAENMGKLDIMERKIIKLKGVKLYYLKTSKYYSFQFDYFSFHYYP